LLTFFVSLHAVASDSTQSSYIIEHAGFKVEVFPAEQYLHVISGPYCKNSTFHLPCDASIMSFKVKGHKLFLDKKQFDLAKKVVNSNAMDLTGKSYEAYQRRTNRCQEIAQEFPAVKSADIRQMGDTIYLEISLHTKDGIDIDSLKNDIAGKIKEAIPFPNETTIKVAIK